MGWQTEVVGQPARDRLAHIPELARRACSASDVPGHPSTTVDYSVQ
jgi:hypothetical protein